MPSTTAHCTLAPIPAVPYNPKAGICRGHGLWAVTARALILPSIA